MTSAIDASLEVASIVASGVSGLHMAKRTAPSASHASGRAKRAAINLEESILLQ
jgi:hypothetical protein